MCKPIVKWVGGKRQLINDLKRLMPKNYNRYFEPFVGGGALFFELKPNNAFINDYNSELINLYKVVRDEPSKLIEDTRKHKNEEEYYYELRALDRDENNFKKLSNIKRASRFLYLNKTGFNGLYRVNSKGEHNVPFGRYENPNYCDFKNIKACSSLLKSAEVSNQDFEVIRGKIEKEDFVYLDPPYAPLSASSSFTSYTNKGFDKNMQIRLKDLCDYIDSIGAYFMLSNSYTDYILNLYETDKYTIHIVNANRKINANGDKRGKIREVIITNY